VIHLKDVTEACPLSRNQLVQMLESEATPTDRMRPIKREGEPDYSTPFSFGVCQK